MKLLICPFCGSRDLAEFAFRKTLPNASAGAYSQTYERFDRPSESLEHWQHVAGCRAWLLVLRNPSTGDVLEVNMPGGSRP